MKNRNIQKIIEQFVDFLLPDLTPYSAGLYIYLLRNSYFINGEKKIRIGKRTIAKNLGSSRAEQTNYAHITKLLNELEKKSCINVLDTTREGTLYLVFLPEEIPLVKEKLNISPAIEKDSEDFFNNPEKRKEIFESDNYICFYCGEKITPKNATLDHFIPQHMNGKNNKDNLKTSCLICNSIKSGKTFDEAAPLILKNIQERRDKKLKTTKI
jgi:hypothetical protein